MARTPEPEPEPTRPTWKMALIAVAAILIGEAAYHWADISANAQIRQIEHFLGIDHW